MRRAIRKHLRDFIAILFLVVVAAGVAGYILSNQRFYLPAWVPGIGSGLLRGRGRVRDRPGGRAGPGPDGEHRRRQGRRHRRGRARGRRRGRRAEDPGQVQADLPRREDAPAPEDRAEGHVRGARPRHAGGRRAPRGRPHQPGPDAARREPGRDPRPARRRHARVPADPRQRRRRGVHRRPVEAVHAVVRRRPARDVQAVRAHEQVRREVHGAALRAARRTRSARSTASASSRRSWARRTRSSRELVESSNANFQVFAEQEANLRRALQLLPGTLSTTQRTLGKVETLADELGPGFQALLPFARNLGPALRDTRPALRATTPIIRDEIRPFTRIARSPVRKLRAAAEELAPTTSRLVTAFGVINNLLDTLAYNPPGNEEGFLFWTAWANHNAPFVFNTQDAHGPIRRGNFLVDCASLDGGRGAGPRACRSSRCCSSS